MAILHQYSSVISGDGKNENSKEKDRYLIVGYTI